MPETQARRLQTMYVTGEYDMRKISVFLVAVAILLAGCTDYSVQDYVADLACKKVVSEQGQYRAVFVFENCSAIERKIIAEYPTLQHLVHTTLAPDARRFNDITVFVPANDDSWTAVSELVDGKGSTARAFTVWLPDIYVIFRPDYWVDGSDTRLRRTAVHELAHHVSIEIYDDVDPDHKRCELWNSGGLVDQILDLYKKQESR